MDSLPYPVDVCVLCSVSAQPCSLIIENSKQPSEKEFKLANDWNLLRCERKRTKEKKKRAWTRALSSILHCWLRLADGYIHKKKYVKKLPQTDDDGKRKKNSREKWMRKREELGNETEWNSNRVRLRFWFSARIMRAHSIQYLSGASPPLRASNLMYQQHRLLTQLSNAVLFPLCSTSLISTRVFSLSCVAASVCASFGCNNFPLVVMSVRKSLTLVASLHIAASEDVRKKQRRKENAIENYAFLSFNLFPLLISARLLCSHHFYIYSSPLFTTTIDDDDNIARCKVRGEENYRFSRPQAGRFPPQTRFGAETK